MLRHMFPPSWKWTDAIIRLLCHHVCKRLPYCYLDVCHPIIWVMLLSTRFLTLQEEIKVTWFTFGYMVNHQATPTAIMPGLWQWLSHGRVHCLTTQLTDSCKNMTAFFTALNTNDTPWTHGSTLVVWSYGITCQSMGPWTYSAWSYVV
jgi:hypothetical protein